MYLQEKKNKDIYEKELYGKTRESALNKLEKLVLQRASQIKS